ncbi:uncharacterized protein BCR38DRAFT_439924 [Pseudomassariella vexata]|uniref:Uncharacterized protein n=1 Tax=Pseudomassariella vexata TaxID=1141098 RepID=A0A1Y2DRM6_9PEZI|nr:uncharacterized protein BCR38DRAFT_439924 [Pseudomassariella vexata]ORY61335.1 hypothetical protein BCR38DRAFT_439924 [Pseudomassariella vexata]
MADTKHRRPACRDKCADICGDCRAEGDGGVGTLARVYIGVSNVSNVLLPRRLKVNTAGQ